MSQNEFASPLPRLPATPCWAQHVANPVNFCLLGLVYASWAARIPTVRDALQFDAAQLSIALLGGGAGAVLAAAGLGVTSAASGLVLTLAGFALAGAGMQAAIAFIALVCIGIASAASRASALD